jgi:hypothetical protein
MDELIDTPNKDRSQQYLTKLVDARRILTDPFGENKMGARVYRRAERLTLAIYLITNHIPEEEPIRKSIRDTSGRFLREVLDVRSEMRSLQSSKVQQVKATIRELISLMRILAVSGFSSLQNTEIMIEALDELGSFIGVSERSILSEGVKISKEDVADIPIKDKKPVSDSMVIKDKVTAVEHVQYREERKSTRSDSVLETLRSGGVFGIKDISANFPEYSEKMIQRELSHLVSQGLVRKIGLKRWSRYVIAEDSAGEPAAAGARSAAAHEMGMNED